MTTHCHPDEWTTRVQLAACYRIFAMLGWTEMIYNHITLRLPPTASGDEKQFLINPFGSVSLTHLTLPTNREVSIRVLAVTA